MGSEVAPRTASSLRLGLDERTQGTIGRTKSIPPRQPQSCLAEIQLQLDAHSAIMSIMKTLAAIARTLTVVLTLANGPGGCAACGPQAPEPETPRSDPLPDSEPAP